MKERVRGQDGSLGVVAQVLEAAVYLLPEGLRRGPRAFEEGDQGAFREVAREAVEGVEEERQVVLNARRGASLGYVLVHRAGPGVDVKG